MVVYSSEWSTDGRLQQWMISAVTTDGRLQQWMISAVTTDGR